jgi:NADH pyrophosphatase NudC (nudix superfamily)
MPKPNAELKARLQAEAEAAIEELLANRKAPAEASLADIEQVVRTASLNFEQALTAALLAESAAELPAWPACPQCGQRLKNKGKRRRRVVTETGEVEIERHYYHCAACGQGLFPPG